MVCVHRAIFKGTYNECSLGVCVCVAGDFPLNKQMFPWRVFMHVGVLLVCEVLCI